MVFHFVELPTDGQAEQSPLATHQGSDRECKVLIAGCSMICRRPLGQRISTRSIPGRSPKPK
jgi:hypothetical protein